VIGRRGLPLFLYDGLDRVLRYKGELFRRWADASSLLDILPSSFRACFASRSLSFLYNRTIESPVTMTTKTEDTHATPPLDLQTPWKSSPNGRPKPLTPPSDRSRDSADAHVRPVSPRSIERSPVPHRAHDDTASEPALASKERNAPPPADAPAGAAAVERRPSPGQRRPLSVISAMSCSMCSVTGVNSLWRRDRAGKPICGKCCEQLRRRMNPRYVSSDS
jgi:hypothetical protein